MKAGAKIDSPIYLQDAMATALDIAGADRKKALFSKFRELQKRYDDKLDIESVFPEMR